VAGRFVNLLGTVLSTFGIGPKGARTTFSAAGITAERVLALPDKSGTVALTVDAFVPTLILTGTTYSVPDSTQALFAYPIEINGSGALDISGLMLEVT
jgi:hypothetical protein